MLARLKAPRSASAPGAGGVRADRQADDADADDWEAVDPDPAELEEWEEPDATFDDGFDEDADDQWDEADDWREFDHDDDEDDD